MAQDNITQLENRVDELLRVVHRLRVENKTLTTEFAELARKNSETRQRLQSVIDRIKSLEEEAEAQQV